MTKIENDWLQSGSTIKTQLLSLLGARPGPMLLWEAWRNDPVYAYLVHLVTDAVAREKFVTFTLPLEFEEFI